MTTFERFERQIPELMTELAPTRVPDYFDDMLRRTAGHRQRPAWTYFERWLPMGVLARTVPMRPFSWRPLVVFTLLGLLIAAGLVAYIGSRQQRLPEPFGLARNGQIVFSTADRDIMAVDPTTGTVSPLISGPTDDQAPWFSPDGRKFVFVRMVEGGAAYFVANADGSDARQLVAPDVDWFEWSPSSDRIVVQYTERGTTVLSVVDVATGEATRFDPGIDVLIPVWRPNHDQILFASDDGGARRFYLVNPDGTGLRKLPTKRDTINEPSLSPDGKSIAYTTWESGLPGREGRIHILDIDSGVDRQPALPGSAGSEELSPRFSPDGSKLLIDRYEPGGGYRLIVAPVDGGAEVALGESHPERSNGSSALWSPDGKSILVTYSDTKRTWLFAADGSSAQEVRWTTTGALTWQRLAP
jgi:Tol biopolymer transport system component